VLGLRHQIRVATVMVDEQLFDEVRSECLADRLRSLGEEPADLVAMPPPQQAPSSDDPRRPRSEAVVGPGSSRM
jgi:hypothetical protein